MLSHTVESDYDCHPSLPPNPHRPAPPLPAILPPPSSSVHGIFQSRILERVAISSCRGLDPGIKSTSFECPALAGFFFFLTSSATWETRLVPQPEIKPVHPAEEAQSLNDETTRDIHQVKSSVFQFFKISSAETLGSRVLSEA